MCNVHYYRLIACTRTCTCIVVAEHKRDRMGLAMFDSCCVCVYTLCKDFVGGSGAIDLVHVRTRIRTV